MDIGQPKRIIEIVPATLPVPGELEPAAPEAEPAVPSTSPTRPSPPSDLHSRDRVVPAARALEADIGTEPHHRLARVGAHRPARRRRACCCVPSPEARRPWRPREAAEATCKHGTVPPLTRPRLHVRAARHRTPWRSLRETRCPAVVGRVALWGRVIEHEHGYRAEFAYPQRLALICQFCFWMGGARPRRPGMWLVRQGRADPDVRRSTSRSPSATACEPRTCSTPTRSGSGCATPTRSTRSPSEISQRPSAIGAAGLLPRRGASQPSAEIVRLGRGLSPAAEPAPEAPRGPSSAARRLRPGPSAPAGAARRPWRGLGHAEALLEYRSRTAEALLEIADPWPDRASVSSGCRRSIIPTTSARRWRGLTPAREPASRRRAPARRLKILVPPCR